MVMPHSLELPPELSVLTTEHYIMNQTKTPWSWDKLAQLLVRMIANDFAVSNTRNHRSAAGTPVLVSNVQSYSARQETHIENAFVGISSAATNVTTSNG